MFVTTYLQEEETFWNNTCLAKAKFCSQFGSSLIHPTTKKNFVMQLNQYMFHAGIALRVFMMICYRFNSHNATHCTFTDNSTAIDIAKAGL